MQKCIIAEVHDKINSFFSKKQFFQNIVDQPAETKSMKLRHQPIKIPPEPSRAERATRTDLALEQSELWHRDAGEAAQLPGVRVRASEHRGIRTTWVEVLDEQGSRALGKPVGSYVTLELGDLSAGAAALTRAGRVLAEALGSMMGLDGLAPVLVVGLGNEDVTPDALGPLVLRRLLITRHLQDGALRGLRPVSALQPGVLGSTGMESLEIVQSVVEKTRPSALIAVDALAPRAPVHHRAADRYRHHAGLGRRQPAPAPEPGAARHPGVRRGQSHGHRRRSAVCRQARGGGYDPHAAIHRQPGPSDRRGDRQRAELFAPQSLDRRAVCAICRSESINGLCQLIEPCRNEYPWVFNLWKTLWMV